jgi:hypothetical protein
MILFLQKRVYVILTDDSITYAYRISKSELFEYKNLKSYNINSIPFSLEELENLGIYQNNSDYFDK